MALETKDKMGKLCKILYLDRVEMADFCFMRLGIARVARTCFRQLTGVI